MGRGSDVLATVRARNDVPPNPIDRTPPVARYDGVYYATWLEDLIHNPYKFYAERILHLRERADIGDGVGAREFGIMIHSVLENCARDGVASESEIKARLTEAALKLVGGDSVLFRFWRNRFVEIAPAVSEIMRRPAEAEKEMETFCFGRRLIARADRVEDGRRVIDYKTGGIPSDKQLGLGKDGDCTMPQLPVEALILRENTGAPVSMAFLRLQKKRVGLKEYDSDRTAEAIAAAEKKLRFLFAMDSYPRPEHHLDEKYAYFDDLCRADD
jgi:ATP-dependent helicase/nuclease subunit B